VPGVHVEALHHRIGSPMPVAGECERLSGEVGTERTRNMRDDVECVEVAARTARQCPWRLPRRGPVEVRLDVHTERVGRAQRTESVYVCVLESAVGTVEADIAVADHRRRAQLVNLEMEAVVDREPDAANLSILAVDD